jgi:hypothetical protein
MTTKTEAIRTLNDELRQNLGAGAALITAGVAALGPEAVARIVKTIAVFDDFCHANDPYEEHDFGSLEADGHTIFFKIDYFDSTLTVHSPDPSDPGSQPNRRSGRRQDGDEIVSFPQPDLSHPARPRRSSGLAPGGAM